MWEVVFVILFLFFFLERVEIGYRLVRNIKKLYIWIDEYLLFNMI